MENSICSDLGTEFLNNIWKKFALQVCAMAHLSLRTPLFDHRPVQEGFVVDKVALRTVYLPVITFSPVRSILPCNTDILISMLFSSVGRAEIMFKTSKYNNFLSKIGNIRQKNILIFPLFQL